MKEIQRLRVRKRKVNRKPNLVMMSDSKADVKPITSTPFSRKKEDETTLKASSEVNAK
jgi:hypothetical protein